MNHQSPTLAVDIQTDTMCETNDHLFGAGLVDQKENVMKAGNGGSIEKRFLLTMKTKCDEV